MLADFVQYAQSVQAYWNVPWVVRFDVHAEPKG